MKKLVAIVLSVMLIATVVPFSFSVSAAEAPQKTGASKARALDVEATQEVTTEPVESTEPTGSTESTEPTTEATEPTTEATEPTTQATQPTTEATQPTTQPVTQPPTQIKKITPAKVKNFIAKLARTTASLSWSLSANATKYVIQRATLGSNGKYGDYVTVKTTGANTKSFKNKGLNPATVYRYRIYAYRVTKDYTTNSAPVYFTDLTQAPEVNKVVIKDKKSDSLKVQWSKSKFAAKYLVYRSVENSKGKMQGYLYYGQTKKTGFTDKELSSGTVYKYKIIVCCKKSKYLSYSNGKGKKTMTKLLAPEKFVTKSVGAKAIKLGWSKVPKATKYELYKKSGSAKEKLIATLKSRRYTDKNITTGADYVYKVRGVRTYNKKNYAGPMKIVSSSAGIKGITDLSAKSFLNKALLAWTQVYGASGYEVFVQRANGSWRSLTTTTNCAYFSNRLKTGKVYKFAVKPYKLVANEKLYGGSKKVAVKAKSNSLYGSAPSGTWVEVSIDTQMLFMYVNNKLYVSTPVVTGNIGDRMTSKGLHHVISKKSPARLRGSYGGSSWDTTVNYWLGFTSDGQGIHDATWRSAFGGSIYKGDGSHGCVNTPLAAVSKVYSKAYVGMPVIVY